MNRIISELPKRKWRGMECVDRKALVGKTIKIEYNECVHDVLIEQYIKGNPAFYVTNFNNYKYKIICEHFLNGIFGGVLGITYNSKNKFEYSEEYNCWFGWTQNGEKFAFDGDEETVDIILNNTWIENKGKIICGRLKTTLSKAIYGNYDSSNEYLTYIGNELNLSYKWLDNRLCNISKVNRTHNNSDNFKINYKKEHSYNIIDKDYYYEVIVDGGTFKIDKNDEIVKLIKMNSCYLCSASKTYVNINSVKLHRVLFGIVDKKYQSWHVDHINGDGTDNRMSNLVITDHYGNMCNKKGKGYSITNNNTFLVQFMCDYPDDKMFISKIKRPTYKTEEEAIEEVNRRREYVMKNRLQFNSREELDEYILKKAS